MAASATSTMAAPRACNAPEMLGEQDPRRERRDDGAGRREQRCHRHVEVSLCPGHQPLTDETGPEDHQRQAGVIGAMDGEQDVGEHDAHRHDDGGDEEDCGDERPRMCTPVALALDGEEVGGELQQIEHGEQVAAERGAAGGITGHDDEADAISDTTAAPIWRAEPARRAAAGRGTARSPASSPR